MAKPKNGLTKPKNGLPHNVHDRGFKRLFSFWKILQQFIQGYVEAEWKDRLDYSKGQKMDKSFILKGFEEKEADILYRVPLSGEDKEIYLYILIEHQSTVDYTMAFRILTYLAEIWKDFYKNSDEKLRRQKGFRFPPVFPVVLYNGADSWTALPSIREMVEQGELFAKFIPDFSYYLVDIPRIDRAKLEQIGDCLSGVFLLEQDIKRPEFEGTLRDALEIIDRETDEELWKAIIDCILLLLKRKAPEKVLEVIENVDLNKHTRKEIRSMLETMPAKLVSFGKEEGRKEEARESIIEVLEAKFQNAPVEIRDSLDAITVLENLRALLKQAVLVKTIDDFKATLNKMTSTK